MSSTSLTPTARASATSTASSPLGRVTAAGKAALTSPKAKSRAMPSPQARAIVRSVTARDGTAFPNAVSTQLFAAYRADLDSLRSKVTCTICVKLLYEPYTLHCGHTYCYSCLCQWFHGNRHKKTCPDCREQVSEQPAPAYLVRDLVEIVLGRPELLATGETVEEHRRWRQEEAECVERDRANTSRLTGGLFRGCFQRRPVLRPLRDTQDGVMRCPTCHWELVDNGWCGTCGRSYGGDGQLLEDDSLNESEAADFSDMSDEDQAETDRRHGDDMSFDEAVTLQMNEEPQSGLARYIGLDGSNHLALRARSGRRVMTNMQVRRSDAPSGVDVPTSEGEDLVAIDDSEDEDEDDDDEVETESMLAFLDDDDDDDQDSGDQSGPYRQHRRRQRSTASMTSSVGNSSASSSSDDDDDRDGDEEEDEDEDFDEGGAVSNGRLRRRVPAQSPRLVGPGRSIGRRSRALTASAWASLHSRQSQGAPLDHSERGARGLSTDTSLSSGHERTAGTRRRPGGRRTAGVVTVEVSSSEEGEDGEVDGSDDGMVDLDLDGDTAMGGGTTARGRAKRGASAGDAIQVETDSSSDSSIHAPIRRWRGRADRTTRRSGRDSMMSGAHPGRLRHEITRQL